MSVRRRRMLAAAAFVAGLVVWGIVAGWIVPAWIATRPPHPVSGLLEEDRLRIWSRWTVLVTALWCLGFAAAALRSPLRRVLRTEPAVGAGGVLLAGALFGLIGGFVEALAPIVRGQDSHPFGTGMIWMMPASAAIGFTTIALLLIVVARAWRRPVSLQLLVTGFGALALFGVGHALVPQLHPLAIALLGTGIATQAGRVAVRAPARTAGRARLATFALTGLVVLLAAARPLWFSLSERRAVDGLPPAMAGAPNVLLLILDTVRAKSLDLHGHDRATSPNLSRLAASAITFDLAVSPSPWTLPAHASFFTGRLPQELDVGFRTALGDAHPTLAEALTARGYRTGGFVGNLWFASREHGLARGFSHYEDYRATPGTLLAFYWLTRLQVTQARALFGVLTQLGRPSAADVNRHFLEWLDAGDERPFFGFLNYFDAHHPYETRPPFTHAFTDRVPRSWLYRGPGRSYEPAELREITDGYESAIRYADEQLGVLLRELDARGRLDETIIIVASDHGELLGEHGLINHGNALYMELLHVPLVIRPAGGVAAMRVAEPVSLRDLPATVTDLVNGRTDEFPGRSLRTHWEAARGTEPLISHVRHDPLAIAVGPVERGDMHSVVYGSLHYIRNGDGIEEVYDLRSDPGELRDLRGADGIEAELTPLRAALAPLMVGAAQAHAAGSRR